MEIKSNLKPHIEALVNEYHHNREVEKKVQYFLEGALEIFVAQPPSKRYVASEYIPARYKSVFQEMQFLYRKTWPKPETKVATEDSILRSFVNCL